MLLISRITQYFLLYQELWYLKYYMTPATYANSSLENSDLRAPSGGSDTSQCNISRLSCVCPPLQCSDDGSVMAVTMTKSLQQGKWEFLKGTCMGSTVGTVGHQSGKYLQFLNLNSMWFSDVIVSEFILSNSYSLVRSWVLASPASQDVARFRCGDSTVTSIPGVDP